jgi:hypothetical protein
MIVLRSLSLLIFGLWLGCGSAQADKRVALVIGNSAYKNAPRLANPVNDAGLVGGMFRNAGFDTVEIKLDLNASEMRRSLREFAARTRDADMAVIYYAGHGIELDGSNYLVPTDAMLETDGDVLDERRSRSIARCMRSNRPNNSVSSSSMRAATTLSPRR